jgi:ABC-type spermidine/putrescine transport system permease subunit I
MVTSLSAASASESRARRAVRARNLGVAALGLPALLFLALILLYPLSRFVVRGLDEGGFAVYRDVVTDAVYLRVFFETFLIGAAATAITIAIAYPLANFLATTNRTMASIGFFFVLLPFWTSIVVRTYAWMILLGRNGIINSTLLQLGIVDEPIPLMFNHVGNLIGMVHWLLPFAVFPIYGSMARLDRRLMRAAGGLGASGWQSFRRVYLPLTLPGVLAAAAIVFVLSIAAFVTPALLGGGKVIMIAQIIEQQVRQFLDWPLAAALAVVLTAAALLFYTGLSRALGRSRHVV